jgi:hypothetical protein
MGKAQGRLAIPRHSQNGTVGELLRRQIHPANRQAEAKILISSSRMFASIPSPYRAAAYIYINDFSVVW